MTRVPLARREPLTIGATAPLFCASAAAVATAGAVAATLVDGRAAPWWAEATALALLVSAGAVLTVGAGPFLAPFRRRVHVLVLVLLLLGLVVDDAAHTGDAAAAPGGPALIVLPPLLLALAVVRPPGEVLVGGVLLAAASTVAAALVLPPTALTPARLVATATAGAAPALAAAALGRVALRRLATADAPSVQPAAPTALRLSVQQEAVARVEAEALPLLDRVAASGVLAPADQALAHDIADRLRAALVADLARGWLAQAGLVVEDGRGYGERMTAGQRTALRTALAALPLADPARPGSARVDGQDRDALLRLELPLRDRPGRRRLAALVPLLRSAFPSADLRVEQQESGPLGVLVATWSVES